MKVLLINVDSKIPNLALMRLAAWHRRRGDEVFLQSCPSKPDRVYSSSIFKFSARRQWQIRQIYPDVIEGGTGYEGNTLTLDAAIGEDGERIVPDYSLWPEFSASIGFTARGCRLACKFCVVPSKEGKPCSVHTISEIWRGEPWPKHLLLLDNDFFGQPKEQWQARLQEIRDSEFKVCLNQGINLRLIDRESAAALASVDYRDDQFKTKRLYTAWDNIKDEARFKQGVDVLRQAGISPKHLLVYMLVGYAPQETIDEVMYRFREIDALGCLPYPMVFDRSRQDLKAFARWVIRRYYQFIPWEAYRHGHRHSEAPMLIPCP